MSSWCRDLAEPFRNSGFLNCRKKWSPGLLRAPHRYFPGSLTSDQRSESPSCTWCHSACIRKGLCPMKVCKQVCLTALLPLVSTLSLFPSFHPGRLLVNLKESVEVWEVWYLISNDNFDRHFQLYQRNPNQKLGEFLVKNMNSSWKNIIYVNMDLKKSVCFEKCLS